MEKKIRANQGHSIDVDLDLEIVKPPDFLWHGTAKKSLSSIFENGLKPMSRKFVHLSLDKETAMSVGSRHGEPILLKIKALEMYESGYSFYCSKNKVWLIKEVPSKYILSENNFEKKI